MNPRGPHCCPGGRHHVSSTTVCHLPGPAKEECDGPGVMSVLFSSPLRRFSPEDRFLPGNGPGQSSSEFSASECLRERQTADAGIPDTVKERRWFFSAVKKQPFRPLPGPAGSCLPAPRGGTPGVPPAFTRCAWTVSAETLPRARLSVCLSGRGPLVLFLHL